MTPSLLEPPLLARLKQHPRILIAGAGGGFDVYAGLPLYVALRAAGREVFLANLTFTYLGETDCQYLAPHLAVATTETMGGDRYFPERRLAEWLHEAKYPPEVYVFERVGVRPLREAYAHLVRERGIGAVVLVDGGTDILMRGDEAGLGTPEEDMTSLAAVSKLSGVEAFVASIGFGIDTYHGVCHAHVLENIAALERDGGYLGAFSVTAAMPEGRAYVSAVSYAQKATLGWPSIVNGSIAAAIEGPVRRRPLHVAYRGQRALHQPADGDLLRVRVARCGAAFALPRAARGNRDDVRGQRAHRGLSAQHHLSPAPPHSALAPVHPGYGRLLTRE